MNEKLFNRLLQNETDIDGALKRLYGNESLYIKLLNAFLQDTTMSNLDIAIGEKDWDTAFTSAHALKGLAGNLGLVPLFYSIGELVVLIRTGRISEIDSTMDRVRQNYNDIISTIEIS